MAQLQIRTLGGLSVERDGRLVAGFASRKAEALLVYLACNPRPHARETLADLLWDDRSQRQALSNLRVVLSSLRQTVPEEVTITRHTVALTPHADVWLDAAVLEDAASAVVAAGRVEAAGMAQRVQATMAHYRGDFLEGYSLREARQFEGWAAVERERLHGLAVDLLLQLARWQLAQGAAQGAAVTANRLLAIEPLAEAGHRQLMRALAAAGQRSAALAQYERCRQILAEELDVAPAAETEALAARLRADSVPQSPEPQSMPLTGIVPRPLAALRDEPLAEAPALVGREQQLAWLDARLEAALGGQGHIVFLTGEVGSGKTTLAEAFVRRSQRRHPDLLVGLGAGSAYSGQGDPYRPFRELLDMLVGGEGGAPFARQQARRSAPALPTIMLALLEHGPHLLDSFIPVRSLTRRLEALPSLEPGSRETLRTALAAHSEGAERTTEQLVAEFADVLRRLAAAYPLLLVVDDLQWADAASLDLLFHIARQLPGRRILLLATYRPAELSLEAHPLAPLLAEFRRLFGDVWLDLDGAEGGQFVSALLDSEPNRLDEAFRERLYRLTGGHPLFTVEILRELQARGDLVRDDHGRWREGPHIQWATLPARVEGAIAVRLGRLSPELRELLAIATVEGDTFTAQVLADVTGMSLPDLLSHLSGSLTRHHRLVQSQGELVAGEQRLWRYHFSHTLFRHYLYEQIDPLRRKQLHGAVAASLERHYPTESAPVVAALAQHYGEAGIVDKAIHFVQLAGDHARELYAHKAAITHYQQAVALLKQRGEHRAAARTLMKLGVTYHQLFQFSQAQQAYEEGYRLSRYAGSAESGPLSPPRQPLRILVWEDIRSLDPAGATDIETVDVVEQLFSGLLTLDHELHPVPDVALSWQVLDDGRRYLVRLRDDVQWSDGRPVTAGDFEYAWKRALDPDADFAGANLLLPLRGAAAYHQRLTADPDLVGVRALDPLLLQIELEQPTGHFLHLLAQPPFRPVPRHIVEEAGAAWIEPDRIQSNGPFRLVHWQRGYAAHFERDPTYHGRFKGNVERVELSIVPEWQDQEQAFAEGRLDVLRIAFFPSPVAARLRLTHADQYLSAPFLTTAYIGFDSSRPPFTDVRVRQAFAMAIDKEVLAEVIGQGMLPAAWGGFVPPGMPGHSAGIGFPYAPERARRLLAAAGYPDGKGIGPLTFALPSAVALDVDYVIHQWQDVLGVNVAPDLLPFQQHIARLRSGPPALYGMAWTADFPDPCSFLQTRSLRWTKWDTGAFDALVATAVKEPDETRRIALYRQADALLIENASIFPLVYARQHLLLKPAVRHYPLSPVGAVAWKDVILEPA